jgi:hypothetical protein
LRSGAGQPPTQAQIQQQQNTVLNDPHVPDSIKQHLKDQQSSSAAAATGYTNEMKQKQADHK